VSGRSFRFYDASINVDAQSGRMDRRGLWHDNDWETFNRIKDVLEAKGFAWQRDPKVVELWPSLAKSHWLGQRATPGGVLYVNAEVYPMGSKFEFYQEIVTVNHHGGRYDFDQLSKMPYLIRKAFEGARRTMSAHLISRGFVFDTKPESPNPDPLAYFNATWDGVYERRRGEHRFVRDESGWPAPKELASWNSQDPDPITHGEVLYFRDRGGRLARGKAYGGINGMWLVVYGPGPRDYTQLSRHELFRCSPATEPRRVARNPRAAVDRRLKLAVSEERFEDAARFRDAMKRIAA
jgi:hypothetical protein